MHILPKGQKPLQLSTHGPDLFDDVIWVRILCAWFLAKKDISMHNFADNVEQVLIAKGLEPPKSYKDDRTAWEIVEIMGRYWRKQLKSRIQVSPYFGIMADETTDRSVEQQLIIYVKFLDVVDGKFVSVVEYMDLVTPKSGSAEDIKVPCISEVLVN